MMVGRSTEGGLKDQVAIITGGSAGIGQATSVALAREGASVVVVGRDWTHITETIAELERITQRTGFLGLSLDVRQEQGSEEMVRKVLESFGRIDILVTCAGILRAPGSSLKTLRDMSVEEWDEILDTNLKGVFLTNRAVLPTMMRQHKGNIINLSSTSGRKGLAYDCAYCASKFGVIGLSEALAEEASEYGVRVQVVLPGAIDTPMWRQNGLLPQPQEVLPVERVAELIVLMLTMPEDAILVSPSIVPCAVTHQPMWRGHSSRMRP
jgi:NAD(P)-dependent dehydrogenase (short-subunit alcohol dehydrogenase family)